MIKKLLKLSVLKKYVSLYVNESDASKFVFGRILCANKDYVVIYMIAPNGKYDGILVKETTAVIRIEVEDKYSRKMHQLISSNEMRKFNFVLDDHNILSSLFNIAKNEHKIISLELLNSEMNNVVGFVENTDENVCMIRQVDLYGDDDGFSYIDLNDITQVTYDSDDEQIILRLWESKLWSEN